MPKRAVVGNGARERRRRHRVDRKRRSRGTRSRRRDKEEKRTRPRMRKALKEGVIGRVSLKCKSATKDTFTDSFEDSSSDFLDGLTKEFTAQVLEGLVAFDSIPENSRILHFGTPEEAQCVLERVLNFASWLLHKCLSDWR